MTLSPTGRAARAYAERFGWHVFPIAPRTKVPHGRFVRRGHLDATSDPEQLARWWAADPNAGVGLACSASGLVVLDVDSYKDDCEFGRLERELGTLPETVRQLTPRGGTHYLFRDQVGGGYRNPCVGAETKHDGYIVLAPSGHPDVPGIYRWDAAAHPMDTAIADLPDRWLQLLTTSKTQALPSSGVDAAESYLGHAFAALGWLGDAHPDGRRNVRCPWADEHSDGRGLGDDSSAVIFPRAAGSTLGGFLCSHGHCGSRMWRDVIDALPQSAKWAAERAMRAERNRLAYQQLESMRVA